MEDMSATVRMTGSETVCGIGKLEVVTGDDNVSELTHTYPHKPLRS